MFNDSKYTKVYFSIIAKAKSSDRRKGNGIYYERHHVIPRCLGGDNTVTNVVLLTGREHYICHYLLTKMHPDRRLIFALNRMQLHGKSSILYSAARDSFSKMIRTFHKERFENDPSLRERVSQSLTGRVVSQQTKDKISQSQKGKCVSDTTRKKISEATKGKSKRKGRFFTTEHREKLSVAKRLSISPNNCKTWEITDPNGIIEVTNNRKGYCDSHGLNWNSVKSNTQKTPWYKGYHFRKVI